MYEINTSKYIKVKKVLIDGHEWSIKPTGAGQELALSQGERRLKFINTKIDKGTATSEDLDTADRIEKEMISIFKSLFIDGTKDNHEVSEWVDTTSLNIIYAVVEEIKKQSEESNEASGDKTTGHTESTPVPEKTTV